MRPVPRGPNLRFGSAYRPVGRIREAVDHPKLSGEGDHVSFVPDELERGRLVQTVHDHAKGAVSVDFDERAGVRHRKIQRFSIRVERAEREGVKGATEAKLHVKHPRDAGGYLRRDGTGSDFIAPLSTGRGERPPFAPASRAAR